MMTSSNGNISCVTGPLWGESTGNRWIPLTKASDAELWCFLWSVPEQTVEQTIKTPVIWCATALIMELWNMSVDRWQKHKSKTLWAASSTFRYYLCGRSLWSKQASCASPGVNALHYIHESPCRLAPISSGSQAPSPPARDARAHCDWALKRRNVCTTRDPPNRVTSPNLLTRVAINPGTLRTCTVAYITDFIGLL